MAEDLLTRIQTQLRDRMRKLEGAVAEYESLQRAAAALEAATGGGGRAPARARGANARAPAARSKRRTAARSPARNVRRAGSGGRRRAARGANRDAILAVLGASKNGAAASELARRAGVGRVSSYQVLSRLEHEGLARRKERASGPALYLPR